MTVSQLCRRSVTIATQDDSVQHVAQLMRRHHVGSVVIVDRQGEVHVPVGMLTDRDLVIELIAKGVDCDAVTAGDVMSPVPAVAHEHDSLTAAIKRMRNKGVRRMPVVNAEDHLVGILTLDDLLGYFASALGDLVGSAANEQLNERFRRTA